MKNKKHILIVEGGGFKTGFTSGILDAFIMAGHDPFDGYIGVSGGAVACSYFLAKQYRLTLRAILMLTKDTSFLNYRRSFGAEGYMDIDRLSKIASKVVPFEVEKALTSVEGKDVRFVATDRLSGKATYLKPSLDNWIDIVTASCTLPFVTKGKHTIDNVEYFDGGWSDALPARYAYKKGATEITILRTWPLKTVTKQSWTDYFGSWYFKDIPGLQDAFENNHNSYNKTIKFLANPPKEVSINQLAPKKLLKSGTYSYSKKSIMSDYRYGLDVGMQHLQKIN